MRGLFLCPFGGCTMRKIFYRTLDKLKKASMKKSDCNPKPAIGRIIDALLSYLPFLFCAVFSPETSTNKPKTGYFFSKKHMAVKPFYPIFMPFSVTASKTSQIDEKREREADYCVE
jgi:hypothetical protein